MAKLISGHQVIVLEQFPESIHCKPLPVSMHCSPPRKHLSPERAVPYPHRNQCTIICTGNPHIHTYNRCRWDRYSEKSSGTVKRFGTLARKLLASYRPKRTTCRAGARARSREIGEKDGTGSREGRGGGPAAGRTRCSAPDSREMLVAAAS